jgi:hypothetical protein
MSISSTDVGKQVKVVHTASSVMVEGTLISSKGEGEDRPCLQVSQVLHMAKVVPRMQWNATFQLCGAIPLTPFSSPGTMVVMRQNEWGDVSLMQSRGRSTQRTGLGTDRLFSASPVRSDGSAQPTNAGAGGKASKGGGGSFSIGTLAVVVIAVLMGGFYIGGGDSGNEVGGDRHHSASGAQTHQNGGNRGDGGATLQASIHRAGEKDGVWHGWPLMARKAAAHALTAHANREEDGADGSQAAVLTLVAGGSAELVQAAGTAVLSVVHNPPSRPTVTLDAAQPCSSGVGSGKHDDGNEGRGRSTAGLTPEQSRGCIRNAAATFLTAHPAGVMLLRNFGTANNAGTSTRGSPLLWLLVLCGCCDQNSQFCLS